MCFQTVMRVFRHPATLVLIATLLAGAGCTAPKMNVPLPFASHAADAGELDCSDGSCRVKPSGAKTARGPDSLFADYR